jgi:hypothetical protein
MAHGTHAASLNDNQRKLLDEYLLEKKSLIKEKNPVSTEVIQWVQEALKITLTVSMLTRRVGPGGKLFEHEWPGSEISRKGRATSKNVLNACVEAVAGINVWLGRLYTECLLAGLTLPRLPEIPNLREMLAEAQEQLAISEKREPEEM